MKLCIIFVILTVTVACLQARSHHQLHVDTKASSGINNGKASKDAAEALRQFKLQDERDRNYHPYNKTSFESKKMGAKSTGIDWHQVGQDDLSETLTKTVPKVKPAKNVIYFIGDGMGISTLTTGRIFKGQLESKSVTEAELSWESFPYTGMIKTYNTNLQVPDSAGTASAFACGEKTNGGTICVNEMVVRGNCSTAAGNELKSIIHHAQDNGKWTGIVTTARITHATPASAFAHSADRNWENDAELPAEAQDVCWDIARQLIDAPENQQINVLIGGGRYSFIPEGSYDNEYSFVEGKRKDGRDLRQDWLDKKAESMDQSAYHYVENKTDFDNIDITTTEYLLGLFEPSHMKWEDDRLLEEGDTWTEPSLSELVKKSIDILKKGPDGFVLYVEGGRIDHAHHAGNAHRALMDVVALQDAVKVAVDETDDDETLILVTADHSHVFTMAGYPDLDNDILGVVHLAGQDSLALDNKAYLTLNYANGPGFLDHRSADGESYTDEVPRSDPADHDSTKVDYRQDAPVPMSAETHGGEDVAIYASGPMAHLFTGQHEQHYIAHAAMYIGCFGWNQDFCLDVDADDDGDDVDDVQARIHSSSTKTKNKKTARHHGGAAN